MDVWQLVEKYRAEKDRIERRIPRLQHRLRRLSAALPLLEAEAKKSVPAPMTLFQAPEGTGDEASDADPLAKDNGPPRIPLKARKLVLLQFLKEKGATPRAIILAETKIPAGSLSALLARGIEEGWLIREGNKWRVAG
jgi:hypothetical protein